MKEILDFEFLDNTILDYLLALGSIGLAIIFKRLLSRYVAGLLFSLVRRIAKGVDKKAFVSLLISPLEIFLVILVTIIALYKLNYPEVLNFSLYKIKMATLIETIGVFIVIITFIWLLLRIIDFIAIILEQRGNQQENARDNQIILFFKDFFKVMLIIIGLLLVLKYGFGFQISNLITGLSIAGAAIALSTRESIENLIASFIIFFDKPFSVGDLIKVQTITGTVEKIGLRSTRVRTDQKTFVTIPNKQMVDSIMDNLTLRTQRRVFVQLELSAEVPADSVRQLVLAIEGLLQRRKDKVENYTVFLSDIVKNSYMLHVEFFTATIPAADFNMLRQEVNLEIIQLMEEMQIRLASRDSDYANIKP